MPWDNRRVRGRAPGGGQSSRHDAGGGTRHRRPGLSGASSAEAVRHLRADRARGRHRAAVPAAL